jgi:hypothetical protein
MALDRLRALVAQPLLHLAAQQLARVRCVRCVPCVRCVRWVVRKSGSEDSGVRAMRARTPRMKDLSCAETATEASLEVRRW